MTVLKLAEGLAKGGYLTPSERNELYQFVRRRLQDPPDEGMCMLCHCELSGEIHVVTSKTCCELCNITKLLPLTADNVRRALRFYQKGWVSDGEGHG
jgi:hypothetical protein